MKRIISLLTIMMFSVFLFVGCNNEPVDGIHPPMISIDDQIYRESPTVRPSSILPSDYKKVGEVEKKTSPTKPMVKGENYYISNGLPLGTEIHRNSGDDKVIYAKYGDQYIKFELINEESSSQKEVVKEAELKLGKYVKQGTESGNWSDILLKEDQQFIFNRGLALSYLPMGTYSIEGDVLILYVNENESYRFRINKDELIFESSKIGEDLIKKGSVFKFSSGL